MAVFVDDSMIAWRDKRWCHLTADTPDELHEFAEKLGLKRAWYQERPQAWLCHYDVTASKREQAIKLGAVAETWQEAAKRAIAAAKAHMMGESPVEDIEFEIPRCRSCGCTSDNACWHEDTGPCAWAEFDLCTACVPDAGEGWDHPFVMGDGLLDG